MPHVRVSTVLFLAITIIVVPTGEVVRAEHAVSIQVQLSERSQASRQGRAPEGPKMVRPSPKEREAVSQILATKPRPKTLKDADIEYLKGLRDKPAWFGFERRIVHDMWTEMSGKEWQDSEVSQSLKNEKFP
jgi:hypothetical protein